MKLFTPQTLDFLFENCSRNDKTWYQEHKYLYKSCVIEPFTDFIDAMRPVMAGIDSHIECSSKRISRIFRDARFIGNRSFFRDTVWCVFNQGGPLFGGLPGYFFEFSPRCFRYGMGYYVADKASINVMRQLILKSDDSFMQAQKAFAGQTVFHLEGELYKRDHYPQQTPAQKNWLNRKDICLIYACEDFDLFFSDRLAARVADDFQKIAPVYHFLMKAESLRDDR